MSLTFPVDTTNPEAIPELSWITVAHPGCNEMLKYLCYRFDPKCKEVRNAATVREKQRMAEAMSGWHVPDDESQRALMEEVATLLFQVINNPEWEHITSLEFLMDESNTIIKRPIKADTAEEMTKALILKHKASEGLREAIALRRTMMDSLADGDEGVARAIAKGRPKRGLDGRTTG